MQIVTGRRGEPHVTSQQMQAVYRSFLGDFALLDIGEKLRAEAYSNDIVRVYDGVVSVQGIYAVIAYNQYDEVYIEPVSVGKKRIDTIVLHYTKDNTLDVEDMQLDVVQGEEYTDNPIAPVVPEGGDAWEGTTDIQVPIYDVEVTNFGLTVIPHARMLTVIPTLDSIAERIPDTVVTGVKGDSEVLYRDGDVNITKANIGLGNVDNTADTDKPISTATQTALNLKADLTYVDAKISAAYHAGGNLTVAELTSALLITENMGKVYNMSDSGVTTSDFVEGAGKSIQKGDNVGICNAGTEESPVYKFDLLSGFVDLSAYATTSAMNTALAGKVDKVDGKGLSTNDYTTTEKTKLAGISDGATQTIANPADTATETLSKLEVGGVIYDIPQGASGATELSELTDVNLTNVEDNDILQFDETANKWKNSNALQGTKTTSGNPITVTDAAPVNAVNLSMDLEPIQDLHGYGHPWVGGAGKNKSSINDCNASASTDLSTQPISIGSERNYTISMKLMRINGVTVDNPNLYAFRVKEYDSTDTIINIINSNVQYLPDNIEVSFSQTVTLDSNTAYIVITYGNYNGEYNINTHKYDIQAEEGSTATSFAPYSNICPISGRSEVAIERVGKNLVEDSIVGARIYSSGAIGADSYFSMHLVRVIQGLQYTVTVDDDYLTGGFFTSKPAVGSVTYDGTIIDITNKTFIAPITGWFGFRSLVGDTTTQCELGTTATTYEPYAGKTYTIQLGDTVYGGTLDVTRGELRVTHGEVDLGDFEWDYNNDTNHGYFVTTTTLPNSKSTTNDTIYNAICSSYKLDTHTNVYNHMQDGIISVTRLNVVSIYDTNSIGMTASQFKNYVTGQKLVYELAEPYTIQLTPQQIKLLENTNTVYTDYEGDTITIEYQPNNAIGEAVRVVEESYDPEFAVRPVLKKIAFSGTTDSDGAVTLINASDIPSGHKIIPLHITDMTINGSAGTYFVEYEPYNSGDSVKAYCYTFFNGSRLTPVGSAVTGNFYYYDLEV